MKHQGDPEFTGFTVPARDRMVYYNRVRKPTGGGYLGLLDKKAEITQMLANHVITEVARQYHTNTQTIRNIVDGKGIPTRVRK
jgi:hypothetical protein